MRKDLLDESDEENLKGAGLNSEDESEPLFAASGNTNNIYDDFSFEMEVEDVYEDEDKDSDYDESSSSEDEKYIEKKMAIK